MFTLLLICLITITSANNLVPEIGLRDNILTSLSENGFTTLIDLATEFGLSNLLSRPGSFTVFAPTNAAFNDLIPGTLEVLRSYNPEELKRLLAYHIVNSALTPSSLENEMTAANLARENIRINKYGKITTANGVLLRNDAPLIASNGVIYPIDKILKWEQGLNIFEILQKKGFTVLLQAIEISGLASTFTSSKEGPFTLFAPSNTAFQRLPPGALNQLFKNPEELKKIILNHVVAGTFYSLGLPSTIPVLSGSSFPVLTESSGRVKIGMTKIEEADISAVNGVVHVIDAVLLPSPDIG